MTRLLWFFKAAVLCTALFVLSGGIGSSVVAQDGGLEIESGVCQTSATCKQSSNNLCFCEAKNGDCAGCYVPNGGTGCGSCSK
jgi:hypothetical protein